MIAIVTAGFAFAVLLAFSGRIGRGKWRYLPALLPLVIFIYFLQLYPEVQGNGILYAYEWMPHLGVQLDFRLDGLSLLFCLLISGIGFGVFLYSAEYLKDHPHLHRFWGYISLFMASMLGLVLSDNLISLFVFWELTSISSFFLIGFNNENEGSRKSALTALTITGGGGLILLIGFLIMGMAGDTYSIYELTEVSDSLLDNELAGLMVVCILIGAFTKSAQFPFHFWLPAAMKAPTPVSTYLHSATMVKAGVYLLARFAPVLGEHLIWEPALIGIGGITMVYGAVHSIFRTDLKSILAYSTISALGVMMFLLGLGNRESQIALGVFILVHALYKAPLFLVTGIIDLSTGTRDLTKLRGLRKYLLAAAIAGGLAALSSAGLPPFWGFIGKELIYGSILDHPFWPEILLSLAIITNFCLFYAGFAVGFRPFFGRQPSQLTVSTDRNHPSLWIPPLALSLLGLILGLFPGIIDTSLIDGITSAVSQGSGEVVHLHLWHGWNTVFTLSLITVALGLGLYFTFRSSHSIEQRVTGFRWFHPARFFDYLGEGFLALSRGYTRILQNGYLRYYLLTIILFLIGILGYKFFGFVQLDFFATEYSHISFYEATIAMIMGLSILLVIHASSRLVAVVSLGVVGYSLSLFFMDFGAPDLAMTQFAIDTLTVVLFVLVLYRLPKYLKYSNPGARVRDAIVGTAFGGLITLLALEIIKVPISNETSQFYAENAYLLAKGKNIVNVILVDYRGIDTLGEITVISIAAIGVYSLLHLIIHPKTKQRIIPDHAKEEES